MGFRLSPTTMASELRLPPAYTGSYTLDQEEEVVGGPTEIGESGPSVSTASNWPVCRS